MKVKKSLKYFLSYYTIRQDQSRYNGIIKVVMVFNMPRLIINGLVQSGGLVRDIWNKAIKRLKKDKKKVNKALILGFGGGDCAFRIDEYFPKAQITGVEIDSIMIDIANAYFNLHKLKQLKIEIGDAYKYVARSKEKYDLIIVDIFIGEKTPKKFKSLKFINKLKGLLNKNGVVIYNNLFYKKHKKEAKEFVKLLDQEFNKVYLKRVASNLLIYAEMVK